MDKMAGRIGDIYISHHRTTYKAKHALDSHSNSYEMMLFKSGNVDYFINDVTYPLEPGDLTLICPNELHGLFIKDDSPYERIPVHIGDAYMDSFSTSRTDLFSCFHRSASQRVLHLPRSIQRQYEAYALDTLDSIANQEYGFDVKIRCNISMILLLVNQACQLYVTDKSNVSPPLIDQAIRYISAHLTEDISIQTIADELNISRSRISHLFKQYTGMSLWNYVISRRVRHAQALLQEGNDVTTACYESGFNDYAHFVKTFSEHIGISPGKYSKNQVTGVIARTDDLP